MEGSYLNIINFEQTDRHCRDCLWVVQKCNREVFKAPFHARCFLMSTQMSCNLLIFDFLTIHLWKKFIIVNQAQDVKRLCNSIKKGRIQVEINTALTVKSKMYIQYTTNGVFFDTLYIILGKKTVKMWKQKIRASG